MVIAYHHSTQHYGNRLSLFCTTLW